MAKVEWIPHARKAYLLQKGGHPTEACDSYRKALDCLKSDGDKALSANLQINMAEMMIRTKKYDAARDILKSMEPYIKSAEVRDSALAMRFWRRQRDLSTALSKIGDSISNQQEVLRISRNLFQENSITCLQEEHRLMTVLLDSGRFDDGCKIASRFKDLLGRKPSASIRDRCEAWIKEFCSSCDVLVVHQLEQCHYTDAWKLLRARRKFSSDLSNFSRWTDTYEIAAQNNSPSAVAILKEALEILEQHFPEKDAYRTYALFASRLVIPKIYANKIDLSVENDMAKVVAAYNHSIAPEKKNQDTAWIQFNSLYALVLVHRKKYAEAEKVIDAVQPAPETFSDDSIFNGIYQARIYGLAQHFADIGDKANVHKQYDKMRALLLKMHKFKKESVEILLHVWGNTERELIQKIES